MSEMIYTDAALAKGVGTQRWAALARLDVDVKTIGTWDRRLPRHKRVLVPVDVQAMVVSTAQPEGTVAISGTRGDPEPFATTAPRTAGVHLHWAMPDALMRARHVEDATSITLPTLPDRWVVIRTLLPVGGRLAHVAGWVVDAAKGSVTALAAYSGSTADAPEGTPAYSPLNGASGGTLLWSANYEGALNRFALHDDLGDLPALAAIAPQGFHADRASYTVAGWWSDAAGDPLATSPGRTALQDTMKSLGWHISPESPDDADESADPLLMYLRSGTALSSPATSTPTHQVSQYSKQTTKYSDVSPATAMPVEEIAAHYIGISPTHYHSLLHGSVLGVPIAGTVGSADDRPTASSIGSSIGIDLDDVTAALAAPSFGVSDGQRQAAERLMAAFTSDLLPRIATPDGIRDIEEHEHADGFWSFAGPPVPAAKDDRLRADDSVPFGPNAVGRKGRGAIAPSGLKRGETDDVLLDSSIRWKQSYAKVTSDSTVSQARPKAPTGPPIRQTPTGLGASRSVTKPGPRLFRPAPPIVALRGVKPHARHHGDGMFDDEGLRCRWPGECKPGIDGVVDAAKIVPTLGSGAVPAEVLSVVREAVVLDPYASTWLARAGAPEPEWGIREMRVKAEHIRLFGSTVTYDGSGATALLAELASSGPQAATGSTWQTVTTENSYLGLALAQQLGEFSYIAGAPPSPVALTTWRQPWVPLYVEWRVGVTGTDGLDGWSLDGLDFGRATGNAAAPIDREFTGRSPISTSIAKSLSTAMAAWLKAEEARDLATPSQSQLSDPDQASLARLRDLIAPLDLVSASLDGIREQLLGIEYLGGAVVREAEQAGDQALPTASELPVPLFGGEFEVRELRAVDAFGRVLDLPVTAMRTTQTLEVPGKPATIEVRPRVQHGARWLFRLIDPGFDLTGDPLTAPEAYVDQLAGEDAVTPIAGYLLPDHMDESLELFDRFGQPIGELMHDSISDAVTWEPAPGRAVPPDAGPMTGIPGEFGPHAQHAGLLASGLIRADVDVRHGSAPPERSALSAMLRAIDSTLWSIDTFQSIGTPTIAGLVGRPVALVRATLRLDVPDDIDEVRITEAGGADARRAAFERLGRQRFPVSLGDLGRSDDSLLGFFVNDDYTKFHVVDKVVAGVARDSGRHRGHLGLLGSVDVPGVDPIDHPYLDLEDTLFVVPGQVLRLTLLMLPAGRVHLTSGIVPRKSLALAEDWVSPGLNRLVPSLRVGPVLVDPSEIRMPKVASLGENQNFIRRTGPLTWREDPIVSATSAALLPRMPHEVQEGWIRVAPVDDGSSGTTA